MPTYNEQLTVERTGDWNVTGTSIPGESLVVTHSENGLAPGVTFANVGGGHFLIQFTFGTDSNLPGDVAANLIADWHGLTITGQQGMLFFAGRLYDAPPIVPGSFVFANADVSVNKNLSVSGQIVGPTIDSLQATVQSYQSSIAQLQADVAYLQQEVNAITSRL